MEEEEAADERSRAADALPLADGVAVDVCSAPRSSVETSDPSAGLDTCSEPLKGKSGGAEAEKVAKPSSSDCVRRMCCSCQCTADTCAGAWRGRGAWKLWAGVPETDSPLSPSLCLPLGLWASIPPPPPPPPFHTPNCCAEMVALSTSGVSCCTAISVAIIVAGSIFGPLVFYFDDRPYECPVILPNDSATGNNGAASSSGAYSLVEEHSGPGFLDGWDFFDGDDPTQGFVNYLPKEAATEQ